MEIKIKETTYKLDLGIGFALNLDSKFKFTQKIVADLSVEFGMGVQMLVGKLEMGSVEALMDFFNAALIEYSKKSYSQKDLQKAVQEKAIEAGGFSKLAELCIEELRNVGLYQNLFETPAED